MVDNERIKSYLIEKLGKDGIGSQKIKQEYTKLSVTGSRQDLEIPSVDPVAKLCGAVAFWESSYPEQLSKLADSPAFLFYEGDYTLLERNLICVVGTRKITDYGKRICREVLASFFYSVRDSFAVVSGLAYGVDSLVHTIALEVGIPTIGVVAGGIDQGFPKSSASLYRRICEEGLVLAEFPPGRTVVKGMFPMRNRIMAALSTHIIVVESGVAGGSLITARLGLEYGREVLIFPGSVFSSESAGCNRLIFEGATPVTGLRVMYELFGAPASVSERKLPIELAHFTEEKFQNGFTVIDVEQALNLGIGSCGALLTKYEMEGILGRYDSGKYYLKSSPS